MDSVNRASPVKYPAKMGRLVHSHGLPLFFLGLSLYFLVSIVLEKGYGLIQEDGLFETLTAVFYLVGSLFCLIGFVATRRRSRRRGNTSC
jgi:hypothetical protein